MEITEEVFSETMFGRIGSARSPVLCCVRLRVREDVVGTMSEQRWSLQEKGVPLQVARFLTPWQGFPFSVMGKSPFQPGF